MLCVYPTIILPSVGRVALSRWFYPTIILPSVGRVLVCFDWVCISLCTHIFICVDAHVSVWVCCLSHTSRFNGRFILSLSYMCCLTTAVLFISYGYPSPCGVEQDQGSRFVVLPASGIIILLHGPRVG